MKLIIGKNSSIVKKISKKLNGFEIISHKEIKKQDFKNYDFIFLFSWPKTIDKTYWELLDLIPKKKLVFISTISIFSCFLRPQAYSYPNQKLLIEKFVLNRGSSVLRLGIFHKLWKTFTNEVIPYTSYSSLINSLNGWSDGQSKTINLFELTQNKSHPFSFYNYLYFLHTIIRNKYIRIPLDLFLKKIGSKNYGYTKDSLFFFQNEIQIGYGVLGEALQTKNKYANPLTLVSIKKNILLNQNGFVNTLVGYSYNGLKKFWHGVSISQEKNLTFKKKTKLLISRRKTPKKYFKNHVTNITDCGNKFEVIGDKATFFSKKIYFAAGPFENTKLISSLIDYKGKVNFSDHDLILIGQCNTDELIEKNYLIKKGFFVVNHKLFTNKINFLVDFRPYSKETFNKQKVDFYNDTTQNILFKLLRGLSISRINEAFFNKFGFSFYTKKSSCFVQAVNLNCIEFDLLKNFITREKLPKQIINKTQKIISKSLKSFSILKNPIVMDGQHIIGAKNLLTNSKLKKLIDTNKIYIAGSPTSRVLDFRHHSELLISDMVK